MPSYSKPLVWTMTCSVWPVHFLTGAMPIDGSRGSCWMGTVTVVPGGGLAAPRQSGAGSLAA
jgi:hypothetical protein